MNPFRGQNPPGRNLRTVRWAACAIAFSLVILTDHSAQPQQDPSAAVHHDLPWLPSDAIRLPDKNDQLEMQQQKKKNQSYQLANEARKKQIADDTTRLLQLATELKAEVDKSDKETLSLGVIRKADSIEKLAHGVKEKMKLTVN